MLLWSQHIVSMYASFRMLAGVALEAQDVGGDEDEEGSGDDNCASSWAAAGTDEEDADSWAAQSFSAASSLSKFRRSQRREHSNPSVPFSAHAPPPS